MKGIQILLIMILVSLLSGCWGIKEIQHQTYITAIGIDYEDDLYQLYFQSLSYSSVAKVEGGGADTTESRIIVGSASGSTIEQALGRIEQVAQLPVSYSHINTIYVSPTILEEQQLKIVKDFLGRWPFLRYDTWLFATDSPIDKVMLHNDFFSRAPVYSFTYDPAELLRENSFIPVLSYQTLVQRYDEPFGSILIPSLIVKDQTWKDNEASELVLNVNSGYFIEQHELKGHLTLNDLKGLDWFDENTEKLHVTLPEDLISAQLIRPQLNINVLTEHNEPRFRVEMKVKAALLSNVNQINERELKNKLEERLVLDITETFLHGVEMDLDIYQLTEKAFRFHPGAWTYEQLENLDENFLDRVDIAIEIVDEGNYK
ncbi:Ger(x)C family spore germination C-terminal domain-containing protein [Geomicrobium sediminis]|uniref:Ger(X)C family germination protein n=1 Tax=Geomicrobium sediminis TaxID=1347788 RepID=A0ABS2PH14_9BACL|nr:Ger(x)C family spore germination C-terminal domain-containing protein [Geomicrobium sediminis]MBM7634728.1 Ger(x)C family germination protein [Geomicrobium sediminis]